MTDSLTSRHAKRQDMAAKPALSRRSALTIPLAWVLLGRCGSAAAQDTTMPSDVGRKFEANGQVRPFAGNTFVGPLPQQGFGFEAFDALLTICREFPAHGFHTKVALLPPSSYHVTVFGGLNEVDRGTPRWPTSVPHDLALNTATQRWLDKLSTHPPLQPAGFDFILGPAPAAMHEGAPHIPLRPANDTTARRLATLRDGLALLTGIRRPDHARYQYHLTFGYIYRFLTAVESQDLQAATARWMAGLPPVLHIPAIHFCQFKDMYAYQTLHQL